MARKKILILSDYFVPALKAGGPIQSLKNLCLKLSKNFDIQVITRDHDLDGKKLNDVKSDEWNDMAALDCSVYYCSPLNQKFSKIKELIQKNEFDFIYLNSIYSPTFSFSVLRMLFLGQIKGKVVLAPRGELNPGARKIKKIKKAIYLFLIKLSGVPQKVIWHATGEAETKYMHEIFGDALDVRYCANIPNQNQIPWTPKDKNVKITRFISVSRVCQIKNIDFLLKLIGQVDDPIHWDIYGPIEEEDYHKHCLNLIDKLPSHINVNFKGQIEHDRIAVIMSEYHYFLSPTKGENFGHSIFEAFLNGKPVLISDQTPWVELSAQHIGWECALDDKTQWLNNFRGAIRMDDRSYKKWSSSAWQFAKKFKDSPEHLRNLESVFS